MSNRSTVRCIEDQLVATKGEWNSVDFARSVADGHSRRRDLARCGRDRSDAQHYAFQARSMKLERLKVVKAVDQRSSRKLREKIYKASRRQPTNGGKKKGKPFERTTRYDDVNGKFQSHDGGNFFRRFAKLHHRRTENVEKFFFEKASTMGVICLCKMVMNQWRTTSRKFRNYIWPTRPFHLERNTP